MLDDDWIPKVAARDLVVITRDKRIRTKHPKALLYAENGLRVFWIASKKDLSTWDTMCRPTRRWDDIEREIKERGPGPWFKAINESKADQAPQSRKTRRGVLFGSRTPSIDLFLPVSVRTW
jgi:hypothetical protein